MQLTVLKMLTVAMFFGLATTSCFRVRVDPIQIDVRVHMVEEDLDDFFGDLDAQSSTMR